MPNLVNETSMPVTANVAYAFARKDIAPEFGAELRRMLGNK